MANIRSSERYKFKLLLIVFSLLFASILSAQESKFESIVLSSHLLPEIVDVGVLMPSGYSEISEPYPLILLLHGGGGDSSQLNSFYRPLIEDSWKRGALSPAIIVTPTAGRSFYMDYKDGSQMWETFILEELLPELRNRYNLKTDAAGTFIMGISMGGMGALRMAFKHPSLFAAVAVMEPAIEPAFSYDEIDAIDRSYRPEELYQEFFGSPVDRNYWQINHPLYIARENIGKLGESGLQIYIEVGNEDRLNLFRGAEALHRLLYDAGLKHEYRVVHRADHFGDSIPSRFLNTIDFLGRVLNGGF